MSAIDRVIDYMSGLPQASEHASTYATEFTERVARSGVTSVDGVEEEKKLVSRGEKEILARLNCSAKFTKRDLDIDCKIGVGVSCGKDNRVRREQMREMDFMGSRDWILEAAKSRALYSKKESTIHLLDDEQKRKIMAKCPNLAGTESGDIYMAGIHERISVPSDMRHLFTKMFLLLQDYNLNVTSKSEEMRVVSGLAFEVMHNCTPLQRLAAVVEHDVVVDADNFTPEELGLVALAGKQYPSVWYGRDNMYTKCNMESDDVVIISDGKVELDSSLLWGSPDRMYHTMWSVASKMNCLPALMSAIENMRGKCKMVSDMVGTIEGNRINSMMPLSYNLETAFGGDVATTIVTNVPGYMSTSISLVADLLYGSTFKAVASCVAEALGGCGLLLSSRTPKTNRVINGIFRDYGLQHTSAEDNLMLKNWEIMVGRPITWEFGVHLKEYALSLCELITNGDDIELPSLLLTVPSLTAVNTAYGMARGWKGPSHLLTSSKKERFEDSDGIAAVSWLIGDRKCRPAVFYNRVGKKPLLMGHREAVLQAEAEGNFGIGDVGFWIHDDLGGRTDENEMAATTLYRTEYAGTRCAMVYSYERSKWVEQKWSQAPPTVSLRGQRDRSRNKTEQVVAEEEKADSPAVGGLSGVNWGPPPRAAPNPFEHVATLNRTHKIVPSRTPRHTRTGSDGVEVVGSYMEDGVVKNEFKASKRHDWSKGDTVPYTKIDVPGDGSCGIHAFVEDLHIHGRMAPNDKAMATETFKKATVSDSFHDAQELAALSQEWGYNLDVVDVGTGNVYRYGDFEGEHTAMIFREGNHFFTGEVGTGESAVTVNNVDAQLVPGAEFVANVKALGVLFGKPSE